MAGWDPSEYLRFGDDRTRPAFELASRIAVDSPAAVVDLGCGPGNSTSVLTQRWPQARVLGLDSSTEMIAAASAAYPHADWQVSDIAQWSPDVPFDVVFSNAALQWLPGHGRLVERLFAFVAPGGALAFQIPSATYAEVRSLIHEIAREEPWALRMEGPLGALTMEPPGFYYDHLAPQARSVDLWETEYVHVMDSPSTIVDWIASTGLRPFLDALGTEGERDEFVASLRRRVARSYPVQRDGRVLFPFRRMFVIAYA